MKKLILLLALAFVMCGCDENITYRVNMRDYNLVVVDSCEYISAGLSFAHKGNCKYCAERRKKEQEELIRKIKEQAPLMKSHLLQGYH